MQLTWSGACRVLLSRTALGLVVGLVAACGLFRTECERYETRPVEVPYCAVYGNGYCQTTGYRTRFQSVCTRSRCREGYISYDGDCLTNEEYDERRRRDAAGLPLRDVDGPAEAARREVDGLPAPGTEVMAQNRKGTGG